MKVRHAAASFLIAAGFITVPACTAHAQRISVGVRVDDRNVERRAYDDGYRRGVENGQRDARDRRDFKVDRDRDYRDVNDRNWGGDRDRFVRFYRDGYRAGYQEGYQRVAQLDRRRGGPDRPAFGGPRDTANSSKAARVGYRDGVEAGQDDARHRERFDPRRAKRYREGDHDYDGRDGSRDQYKQIYRDAFQQGYEAGFRGVRR